jgi:hypothetical protein
VWIAAEASRRFVEDRRNNAFELLLSTPLDEGQILRGQWLALVQQFGRPLLALVLAESFLGLCLARRDDFASGWTLLAAIFLAFDSIALGWAGIWSGMVCKSRIRAILLSTTVALAAPWGLSYLWTSMAVDYDVSTNAYGVLHQSFIRNMAFHKFIIGLVVDLIVIILASIYLERNFRRFCWSPTAAKSPSASFARPRNWAAHRGHLRAGGPLLIHRFKADESYLVGEGKGPVGAYLDIEGIVALAPGKRAWT